MVSYKPRDYVAAKVKVLDQLGLHNTEAVEERLRVVEREYAGKRVETRIDSVSRVLLSNFYNGDKTYAFKVV